MVRLGPLVIAAPLWCLGTGCLLFTDPINVAPTVRLTGAPETMYRGASSLLLAEADDADQDPTSLSFQWFEGKPGAPCPARVEDAVAQPTRAQTGTGDQLQLMPQQMGAFCVWVVVTDEYGARAFDTASVEVLNREPVAVLEITAGGTTISPGGAAVSPAGSSPMGPAPLPLFTELRLSGKGSTDPDEADRAALTYRWSVTSEGRALKPRDCARSPLPANAEICFTAESAGTYRVELWVTDEPGRTSRPASATFSVRPDSPPCIRETMPPFGLPTIVRLPSDPHLSVAVTRVADDGDPFPTPAGRVGAPMGTFVWRFRRGTSGPFDRFAGNLPSRMFETTGELGPVQIRLEYQDRGGPRAGAKCREDDLVCEVEPGCPQWVTWTVDYR